jgi:hypothetical protein
MHPAGIGRSASARFGASIENFYRSESRLGRQNRYNDGMSRAVRPKCARDC